MKIRDAVWECENLGLRVLEVEFEHGDRQFDSETLRQLEGADYVLVRVPSGQTELIHRLEDDGYRFLATQCAMTLDLHRQVQQPAVARTVCRHVAARDLSSRDELESILSRMDAEMFDTDRISMDPALPNERALQRHRDIVRALFADRRNVCQGLYVGAELVGFFQLQYRSDRHFFASLAGVFSSFKGSGLGLAAIWLPVQWALDNNVRQLSTSNSTNNPDSVRMHLEVGYRIERFDYVLRRIL